jgi:hypothetical protein
MGKQHQHTQRMLSPIVAEQHTGSSEGDSSSSPNSSRRALLQDRQAPKNQPPEVVLNITALQNGMMQLLPGGCQQYVDGAATHATEYVVCCGHSREQQVEQPITRAKHLALALVCSLELTFEDVLAEQQSSLNAPAVQAAAVHLMLELQLVAAGLLQRQWQQGQKAAADSVHLVRLCCRVLELQIRAVLQASGSNSLPAVLLQQTGLSALLQKAQQRLSHKQIY